MPSLKPHGQMSEAFITALFLSVSGGLQDVYTYLYRGKVFANAQTGNIVLLAVKFFEGDWGAVLHYLMPLCAFALGIFAAEFIRLKLKRMQWLHWRQQGASLLRHHLPVRAGCRPWQPCTGPHGQPGHLAFLPAALHQLLPDVPERGH